MNSSDTIKEKLAKHKWQNPPVHPVNTLPMMSDEQIDDLAKDIKENGLQEPIILWRDNREEAKGSTGPFPVYLLDGRNRLAALKKLGITDPTRAKFGDVVAFTVRTLSAIRQITTIGGRGGMTAKWETDCDPLALHLSLNVHRRHLNAQQKRKAIEAMLDANPENSDRVIAKKAKVSPTFVGRVRAKNKSGVHRGQVRMGADGKKYRQPKQSEKSRLEPKKERLQKAVEAIAKLQITVADLAEQAGYHLVPFESK